MKNMYCKCKVKEKEQLALILKWNKQEEGMFVNDNLFIKVFGNITSLHSILKFLYRSENFSIEFCKDMVY